MKEPIFISEEVKQLIAGHLSGSLNPDELSALKAWIVTSPAHKKYFNEIRSTWVLAGKDALHSKEHAKNLMELAGKMPQYNRRIQSIFLTWQRIAASWLIIAIGAGILGWLSHGERTGETQPALALAPTNIQLKMGAQSTIDLSDGSRVWLNGGSQLTYDDAYGRENREVQLTGEACFEVVTNPEKPFVVNTGTLSIKAFGTTFNVKAYPDDQVITTTLVEGKVTITGKDVNNQLFSYEMQPNEQFTYKTGHQPKTEAPEPVPTQATDQIYIPESVAIENDIDTEIYTSWKDNFWIIEKQKLGALSKDFERRYDVRIVFSSENVKNYHFSGTIQNETVEQVMRILRRTIPLKYSFDKNVITIGDDPVLMKEFQSKNR